jgi:hypothetical protein
VSGTAGAGETALLDHFLDEMRADGGVRCARGQALELQGRVQGCTAVLDLLSRLCDEAGGESMTKSSSGVSLKEPGTRSSSRITL